MNSILLISAVFPPEPVVSARLSSDIANELSKSYEVTVISPRPSRPLGFKFAEVLTNSNFRHIVSDSYICAFSNLLGRFRESYSFGKYCYTYISENHHNIDVIYANTWPLMGQYFAVKAAKKFKLPLVMHIQDVYPESISRKLPILAFLINGILLPLDRKTLSDSAKVVVLSEKMKEYLMRTRYLTEEKVDVIRNWHDESNFDNFNQNNIHPLFTFMYLGSISPAAGIEMLIHSFHHAQLKNAQLVIAGNGSYRETCIRIARGYNNDHIKFIDAPIDQVPSIQASADVLLLPLKKGIGLTASPSKLPSYMFSAKPILASVDKESDTAENIAEAQCGWVTEPGNIEMLTSLMKEIVLIPTNNRKALGMNGRKFALAHYSKTNNLQKLVSIITSANPS